MPWFGLFLPQLRMDFATILGRTLAAEAIPERPLVLRPGARVSQDAVLTQLVELGYERVPEVGGRGELARRGGIVDCFPAGRPLPPVDLATPPASSPSPMLLHGPARALRLARRQEPRAAGAAAARSLKVPLSLSLLLVSVSLNNPTQVCSN